MQMYSMNIASEVMRLLHSAIIPGSVFPLFMAKALKKL